MIGNSCLLDTCVIVEVFRNKFNGKNLDNFSSVYISSTILGELYYGAYHSNNTAKKIQQIHAFVEDCIILSPNEETAQNYGLIKSQLRKKGKPIPENDIWIAAISIQYQVPLYTLDTHFKEVDSITLINL